jgi:hypothetical protein
VVALNTATEIPLPDTNSGALGDGDGSLAWSARMCGRNAVSERPMPFLFPPPRSLLPSVRAAVPMTSTFEPLLEAAASLPARRRPDTLWLPAM